MRAGNFSWMNGCESEKSKTVNKAMKKTKSLTMKLAGATC